MESFETDTAELPRRIRVAEVFFARYQPGTRPVIWDERVSGVEKVRTESGESVTLFSSGMQSTPAPGWELFLTRRYPGYVRGDEAAFEWTLYGVAKTS